MYGRFCKIKNILPPVIIFLSFFTNISIADFNNNIYVDDDGNADYSSIQDAINSANDGDTIYVYNGTYHENIIIEKNIKLMGEDKTNTFLYGNNSSVFYIKSDNVEINDLTITNGSNGIYISNSSNCIFSKNTIFHNNVGIFIDNLSKNNLFYHNNFINNNYSAFDNGNNKWYNVRFKEGNYWDDFDKPDEGAYDNNTDGIVDKSYNLVVGINQDLYPLIKALTEQPISDFIYSPSSPYTYELIEFNDASYDIDGKIISWFWDFGNGNISTLQNAENIYIDDGIYNVSLDVTDNYGVTDRHVKQITILNSKPMVSFSYSPNQPDDINKVTFYDESYDKDGGIVKWEWDLGDGTILINPENPRKISHKYNDNGTYNVTLTVYDNDRSFNSISNEIIILNVPPSANFYYKSLNNEEILIVENEKVNFYDTSQDKDGEIVKYLWDFGDGTSSNITNPTHIFDKGGPYYIFLTVYDNDGDSDTKKITLTVLTKYQSSNKSSWTGISLLAIIIIVFILVLVGIAIIIGRKT